MHGTSGPARFVRWVPAAVWALVIFGFSSLQGSTIPGPLGAYSPIAHFTEYAILATLLAYAVAPRSLTISLALALLLTCSLYGVSDEYHQSFVPGRTPDVADWATDTVGAGVAIAAIAMARRRSK